MALLSTLLGERLSDLAAETNLEKGEIFVFHAGAEYHNFNSNFCWKAPGNGTAVVEAWGAGGSGGRMCCCGTGIPGNAGGYTKITVPVSAGKYVCGNTGISCGNASSMCFRGCSDGTCLTVCSDNGCNCLCSQGGNGGRAFCTTSSSIACCLIANYGLCNESVGSSGCFIVCNSDSRGRAYGGDTNIIGPIGCTTFRHCNPCCICSFEQHLPVPAGIVSKLGTMITYNNETDTDTSQFSGNGLEQFYNAMSLAGKQPVVGGFLTGCWGSSQGCGCYEAWACQPMLPYGTGGQSGLACSSVRDSGMRGGMGAVRIKFIGS